MVEDLIARMDRWLAANRADYYAELRPGVTDQALDAFAARFGVPPPEAFRLACKWRNGQRVMLFESFQNNCMFSALEDIVTAKAILDGMIGYDFTDPKWWREEGIPFLHNGGGDHLCLDPMARDFGNPMQLRHDWEDRCVKYESIEAWLADLVRSMDEGTLALD
jgi:cell wall assembly regulator SMI1